MFFLFFKQKTAYEMRISDWSSDVCSSDLHESLAVVIDDAGEIEAEAGIATKRPGRVARQDIDLARLQRGEAVLGAQRREPQLRRVAEHRRRHGAAEIDIDRKSTRPNSSP